MEIPTIFEWDAAKAEANLAKHRVRFNVAIAVFSDPHHMVVETARPSDGESRQKVTGRIEGRLFTVVFVMRDDVCRLISARRSNATEERAYG